MNLQLVKTENFNDISCDFYSADDQLWMSRQQIGLALEYKDPRVAIAKFTMLIKKDQIEIQLLPNWKQLMENLTLVISIMNVAFMKFVEEVDNPRLMPLWIGYGM